MSTLITHNIKRLHPLFVLASVLFVAVYLGLYLVKRDLFSLYRPLWVTFNLHFFLGILALAIACIQLFPAWRKRFPQGHRWLGRLYVLAMTLCAITSFVLLQVNVNPLWSQSLAVTGVLSLICIGLGWYYGFIGQWLKHQVWMVRTVLILFAFMLSRILILGGMSLGFTDFDRVAAWSMYLSWGPSFALHYLWTERRALRRHRVRQVNTT